MTEPAKIDLDAMLTAMFRQPAGSMSFDEPLPGVIGAGSGEHAVLVFGVSGFLALVGSRDGGLGWVDLAMLRVRYSPNSAHRLKFGWAEKGPNGYPEWARKDDEAMAR